MPLAETGEVRGWLFWKGDQPQGTSLGCSWSDLLIGYDMMPLRGLRQTEALLREKHGWEALPTAVRVVLPGQEHIWGPAVNGRPCLNALAYSNWSWSTREHDYISLASWLLACAEYALKPDWPESETTSGGMWRSLVPGVAEFSAEERRSLHYYWLCFRKPGDARLPEDGRRRPTLERHRRVTMALLARVGLDLAPLRFERLAPDALPKDDDEWERARAGSLRATSPPVTASA